MAKFEIREVVLPLSAATFSSLCKSKLSFYWKTNTAEGVVAAGMG